MTGQFKKGDVIAIVETRVAQFMVGSGRPAETSHTIRIVRIESASRDGAKINSYRAYPHSPAYKYDNHYARYKLMAIGGENQEKAKRLSAPLHISWNTIRKKKRKTPSRRLDNP